MGRFISNRYPPSPFMIIFLHSRSHVAQFYPFKPYFQTMLQTIKHTISTMFTICHSPNIWQVSHNPRSKIQSSTSIPTITNSQNEGDDQVKTSSSAGRIKRLVLSNEGRTKLNNYPDREFYDYPRFVKHVDEGFIATLKNLYRETLRPEMEILDLMSSWISHLPEEVKYERVVGHGLNAQELARNPRFDYFFVKDLNKEQKIETDDESFDAVLCTVSVQYLQQPEAVFAEVFRVLKPGGVFVVSFSNRMFYEKAISAWRDGSGYSRTQLVVQYFQCVEGFTQPEIIRKLSNNSETKDNDDNSIFSKIKGLMLGLFSGTDPFYAVVAFKNFKPVYD